MKSPAAILTLAVLTWFGLAVTLLGQAQGTRQRFDGTITLRNVGPQAAPAAVSGTVVAEVTGEPLAGATVMLSRHFENAVLLLLAEGDSALPPVSPTKTNARGEFSFEGLVASEYDVKVVLDGYLPVSLGRSDPGQSAYVTLVAGQHLSNLRVSLIRSARLEGRVQSEGGQLLAGIPVHLIRDDSSTAGVRQRMDSIAQASTAADGSYRLSAFVPGRYILIAGYPRALNGAAAQSFATRIEVPNTDLQTLDFSLDSKGGHAVRGKVSIDGTSVLPADVQVSIRSASPSATTGSGDENVTSAYDPNSGRFEIPGLYPGLYEIYLSSQIPMRCAAATAVVLHDDAGPLDLILRECQRIEIRATP